MTNCFQYLGDNVHQAWGIVKKSDDQMEFNLDGSRMLVGRYNNSWGEPAMWLRDLTMDELRCEGTFEGEDVKLALKIWCTLTRGIGKMGAWSSLNRLNGQLV